MMFHALLLLQTELVVVYSNLLKDLTDKIIVNLGKARGTSNLRTMTTLVNITKDHVMNHFVFAANAKQINVVATAAHSGATRNLTLPVTKKKIDVIADMLVTRSEKFMSVTKVARE